MKLEVGKYYRTRDGRKAKVIEDDGTENCPCLVDYLDGQLVLWCSREGVTNIWDREDDLIAEWTDTPEVETGTLAELNVKPGDVVSMDGYEEVAEVVAPTADDMAVFPGHYRLRFADGTFGLFGPYSKFRIVSRANQAPIGPARTVTTTRNEVVTGTYGKVQVQDVSDRIGIVIDDYFDAEDLTEAIATLTQIRDALAG